MMKNWKIILLWSFIVSFNTMDAQKKYGYINQKKEVVIPAKFDQAQNFMNGLAAVRINDLWGFINTKGEMVIAPKYKTVFDFYSTITKVSIAEVKFMDPNPNYIYINQKGEEVPENSVPGNPVFFDGLKLVRNKEDKFGFENNKGVMVIPAIYVIARDFNGYGWTAVSKGEYGLGVMGCINTKGEMIVPFEFDFIDYNFGKYISAKTKNGENRIYSTDGKFIKVDGVDEIYGFNKEGIAAFKRNGKTGFLDTSGKILVPATFDDSGSSISEGLVKVTLNGQLQVLDILNNKVLCTIPNAKGYGGFKNGIAQIEINKKYGFIDKNGKTIIPAEYLDLGNEFNDGLAFFSEIPKVEVKVVASNPVVTKPVTTTATTTSYNSPTTYSSGNISTSSYALDIFKQQGCIAIYKGSTMYVVKVKGKKKQDINITAAQANQVLGFTTEFKFQSFPNDDCNSLKAKYGGSFTVTCRGEVDLDK
jgi:hypothetical protein